APPAVAPAFASLWCAATGECSNVRRRGRAHALRRVVQTRYSPGDLRPAVEGDRDLLLRWWRGFSIDALEEDDPQTAADLTERTLRGGDAFLWVDGTPVSLAARGRPTRHGITITGVYTPPEHRRRGYAGSAVARLSAQLLVEGRAFVAINTDLANPTANHIYYEVGYRPVGDMDELQFKPRA
ncbi:MAG: GNAT family N-acetyltransferase, partial [Anaerolineae bacterium]